MPDKIEHRQETKGPDGHYSADAWQSTPLFRAQFAAQGISENNRVQIHANAPFPQQRQEPIT